MTFDPSKYKDCQPEAKRSRLARDRRAFRRQVRASWRRADKQRDRKRRRMWGEE